MIPQHLPIGWMCVCGWQPDFASEVPVPTALWTHLEANGWVALPDQRITQLTFQPGWADS